MQKMNLYIAFVALGAAVVAVALGIFAGLRINQSVVSPVTTAQPPISRSSVSSPTLIPVILTSSPASTPSPPIITTIIDNFIPFTSQAPFGQWDDPVFQDGCEEASILMAMHWVNGTPITSLKAASDAIRDISQFEVTNYGEYHDRSAADTLELIQDYFKYEGVALKENITLQDIKNELALGNILVVPMNGRALPNHHYTPPGPERHMLIVRGYDPATREFITNDPGTKFGEAFRFIDQDLYDAIRDYPTGYHEPITSIDRSMIIIQPAM